MEEGTRQASDSQRKLAPLLQLPLGMAVFGSATPISKIVTAAMPVFVGSGARVALGALTLAPFAWAHRGAVKRMSRREWLLTVVIALFGMFGFSALMLFGMRMASGVAGAIVMSTAPAVTAVASIVFAGDRATWRKIAAIGLAVAGVAVLQMAPSGAEQSDDGSTSWLGIALVFAAVCCEAVYTLVGKEASRNLGPTLVAFLGSALSLPLFLPLAIWQWPEFSPAEVPPTAWLALVWYGAGTLTLGTWLWYSGLRAVEGTVAAVFMGVMPLSALGLSYLLLGETFVWWHLAGFAIVFAGVLLISWEHARMADDQ